MKKLLSLLCLLPIVCTAQTPPNFIPRVNATGTSAGTNTHLQSPTIISPLRLDIPGVLPTASGNLQFLLRISGNSNLLSSSLLILDTATGALIGNGSGLTNILEKNIAVTTNGWGNSVLNFSLGTQIETNLTSGLTLTGIDGFVTSNLNWQVIGLYTDGSIRTVTVPAPWVVSGFTSATAVDIPANTFAKLTVESVIGRRTNATIEIFTP